MYVNHLKNEGIMVPHNGQIAMGNIFLIEMSGSELSITPIDFSGEATMCDHFFT